eukprot:TRINITY_DN5813_c0_g1_i1.p1 TRINITY_DN5813_c0_g1~~TRINITY_DN5813_c0_g1_i1.p1  ORF type:complete len:331 (-),score=57.50 TRINITY_DN5813_c0_g1_i1:257-1249(-)
MRSGSKLTRFPNFERRDDRLLAHHGTPDTMIIIHGKQLWAHSQVMLRNSSAMEDMLGRDKLDPMWGRTLKMTPSDFGPRTVKGVTAWLKAIYPPQLVPSAEELPEVDSIAREFRMETLRHRLKIAIASAFDVRLIAQEEKRALSDLKKFQEDKPGMHSGALSPVPEVVFEALSEFCLDQLHILPGYDKLSLEARCEVARRRMILLETTLKNGKAYTFVFEAHPELGVHPPDVFKDCPPELLTREASSDSRGESLSVIGSPVGRGRAHPPHRGGTVVELPASGGGSAFAGSRTLLPTSPSQTRRPATQGGSLTAAGSPLSAVQTLRPSSAS